MRWERTARDQGGVIDRAQLRAHGLTESAIEGLVARRDIEVVLPGVFRPAGAAGTQRGSFFAATLWSEGVLSHWSAAQIWALPVAEGPKVHVSVPDRRFRRKADTIRVHRVPVATRDITTFEGLSVTTRPRTVIDLLGEISLPAGRDLVGRALREGWLGLSELDRRLIDGRCRTGNVRIRQLRQEADPTAHAEFERRVHALLRERGIGGWRPQHPVRLPSGTVVHADIAFPRQRLIIELDGWAWHGTADRFRKDRRRWRGAVAAGWRVVQFTFDDLDHPDRMIAEIVQLLAA